MKIKEKMQLQNIGPARMRVREGASLRVDHLVNLSQANGRKSTGKFPFRLPATYRSWLGGRDPHSGVNSQLRRPFLIGGVAKQNAVLSP